MPGTELSVRELEAAVAEVNQIWLTKGLEAAKAVGGFLLRVLYGGDLEAWRAGGSDAPGLRALAEHPGLRMERTQLWNSLRLVEQLDELGPDVGGRLTMTAHKALFRIEDRRAKLTLARQAAAEGWQAQRVAESVREMMARGGPDRGPHGVEVFVKKVERASKGATEPGFVAALVDSEASPAQLQDWAARLEHRASLLEAVAGRLRRRLVVE